MWARADFQTVFLSRAHAQKNGLVHKNTRECTERTRRKPRSHGNGWNTLFAPHSAREWAERTIPWRTGMDRTHPTILRNEANVRERTSGRTGMDRTQRKERDDPQGAREWTERTRTNKTTPRAHGNGKTRSDDPTTPMGHGSGTERTPTKPKTPGRTETDRTHASTPTAHGNGPNAPERQRRPPGQSGMDPTLPTTTRGQANGPKARYDPQGAREWTERNRKKPTTPRARGNGPNAPYDPQGGREWALTHPTTRRAHENRPTALERT